MTIAQLFAWRHVGSGRQAEIYRLSNRTTLEIFTGYFAMILFYGDQTQYHYLNHPDCDVINNRVRKVERL